MRIELSAFNLIGGSRSVIGQASGASIVLACCTALTKYGKFTIFIAMAQKTKKPPPELLIGEIPPPFLSKQIIWIASSKHDISAMPDPVKASFGHRLGEVQHGRTPLDTKPLPELGGGVFELRERFDGNAYRVMYVVALRKAVYVLHAFMKKSKSGIRLPKPDAELIELRLKRALALDAED